MGDRITTYLPCPQCGKETEQYDASSSLLWVWQCDACGWHDPRSYYEISDHEIVLCTKEEARKNGGLATCKNCGKEVMGSYLIPTGCVECRPKKEWEREGEKE